MDHRAKTSLMQDRMVVTLESLVPEASFFLIAQHVVWWLETRFEYFHPEPESLWRDMPDKFDLHASSLRVSRVTADVLDQAKQLARNETRIPSPDIPEHIS